MSGPFQSQVLKHQVETIKGFDQFRRAVVLALFKSVIMDTPVDTGRLRGSWQVSLGAPSAANPERFDKRGTLTLATILPNIGGVNDTVYLTSNLPYAFGIEFLGKSKEKAPQGMIRRNVLRINTIISKSAKTFLKP